MSEEKVRDNVEAAPKASALKTWLIRIGLLLLAFLLGFVPMWISNRQLSSDLTNINKELRRSRIRNTLSTAAIYARRGEYETARKASSNFFTDVSAEMDSGNAGILTEQESIGLDRVMSERDEIITLLSRNDPASAERLSNAFIEYVGVVPGN